MDKRNADIVVEIREAYPSLSKGQRRIADFVLRDYDKAAEMTASALGAEVGVSESTVVRFAIEMGCEGYPQFQQRLRDTVRVSLTSVQRVNAANHRMEEDEVLDHILLADAEKIKSTLETIDRDAFARAVDMILEAKNIYILGMRSSVVLAEFMDYYFGLLFDNVHLIRPASSSEIFEHLMKLHEDDVLVAFSFPRYTSGIVNATEYAARTGAGVIAITDNLSSPIVPHATVSLIAKSEMASFVDSLVAPLSIINALIVDIARKKQVELQNVFARLETIWDEYDVYDKDKGV
jgi:DNA-binding MurR/RpiR family transcriptional regulator